MSIGISIPSPDFCHFPHCSSGAERSKNKVASVKFKVTSIKHEILSGHTYIQSKPCHYVRLPRNHPPLFSDTSWRSCNAKEMLIWVVKLAEELSITFIPQTRFPHSTPLLLLLILMTMLMGSKFWIQFGKSLANAFIAWFILRGCPKLIVSKSFLVSLLSLCCSSSQKLPFLFGLRSPKVRNTLCDAY